MIIGAIVQARMDSTRLPGKVLKKIKNRTILDYVILRLKFCQNLNTVIIATTTSEIDNILVKFAEERGIDYFRGSEHDVLDRYYNTAKKFHIDKIVRITSDCPLIDSDIVDQTIKEHLSKNADYSSNTLIRTFPRGVDVEVFNFDVLERAHLNSKKDYQREHVTPYIRENPDKFFLLNIKAKKPLNRPDIRITLDTHEDFELINKIYSNYNNIFFSTEDIINFLNQNPELININKNVKQKEVGVI